MTRHIFQTCPTAGEPDAVRLAFLEDPGTWLPHPARPIDNGRWEVLLEAGPVSRRVAMSVGPPWDLGEMTWRILSWQPDEETALTRLLPAFSGEIGFRAEPPGTLVVEGHYAPPGGGFGAAADAIALGHVAHTTVHCLIVAVARRLQRVVAVP